MAWYIPWHPKGKVEHCNVCAKWLLNIKKKWFWFSYQFYSDFTRIVLLRPTPMQRELIIQWLHKWLLMHNKYYNAKNSTFHRLRRGCFTITTQHGDRYIVCQHLHDRFDTETQTSWQTIEFQSIYVIDNTIRRRIAAYNPKFRWSVKGQTIAPRHH